MSWNYFPLLSVASPTGAPSLSSDIQNWLRLRELYKAARDRNLASGLVSASPRHPRHSLVWDRGIITSADNTSISIAGKNWDDTFTNPWARTNPTNPAPPSTWKIVVDDCDPRKVLVLHIDAIFPDSVGFDEQLNDFVASRTIPSIASLVGKTAFIIKGTGLWWSQRILQWPNDLVYLLGGVAMGSSTSIKAGAGGWTLNQWVGKDVVYRDGSDSTDRGRITSNTTDTLSFNSERGLTPAAGGAFYIVAADGLLEWDRLPDYAFTWYRGATSGWYSHYPNDADPTLGSSGQPLSTTQKPIATGSYSQFDAFSSTCLLQPYTAFDTDYWSAADEPCSEPDDPKCPDIWRSLRQIQVLIEDLGENGKFVDPTFSYDGVSVRPSGFRAATLFAAAGINSQESTTGSPITSGALTGSIHVALVMPSGFGGDDNAVSLHYAIIDDSSGVDVVLASGTADWQNGVLIGSGFAAQNDDGSYIYAHHKIVVSLGWTRYVPREFKYFYDNTRFVPDTDGLGNLVDPPTAAYPGSWVTRARSSYYLDHSPLGFVQEGSLFRDRIDGGGGSLGDGVYARYVGDNWNDPGVYGGGFFGGSADINLVRVYNQFFTAKHAPAVQLVIDGQMSGMASSGDRSSLTDSSKDWWAAFSFTYWYSGGLLRTDIGAATSGSTTTLTDTSKAFDGFWTTLGRGRWLGFIVEINISGTIYKRPITSFSGTTIGWDDPLPSTASGKTYQIREPHVGKNGFKDRILRVTFSDNTVQERTIAYNDDKTLWVNSAFDRAIDATCKYQIVEATLGGVYLRSGGAWVQPAGLDPRASGIGDGHAVSFLSDPRANMPDVVKRYGRMMMGDYIFMPFFAEMYQCFNWLQWVIGDFSWTSRHDPAVAELNYRANFRVGGGPNFDNEETDFSTNHVSPDDPPNPTEASGPPLCGFGASSNSLNWGNPNSSVLARIYGYASAIIPNGDLCPVTSQTDFFVKTIAPFTELSLTPNPPGFTTPLPSHCNVVDDTFQTTGEHVSQRRWEFDANGDAVRCSAFSLFSSSNTDYFNAYGSWDRRSGRLGSNGTTPPTRPTAIVNYGPNAVISGNSSRGWEAVDGFQITKYSFDQAVAVGTLVYGAPGVPHPARDGWYWWWLVR